MLKSYNNKIIKDFKAKIEGNLIDKTTTEIELIEQIRNFHNHTYKSRILNDLNVNYTIIFYIKNTNLPIF